MMLKAWATRNLQGFSGNLTAFIFYCDQTERTDQKMSEPLKESYCRVLSNTTLKFFLVQWWTTDGPRTLVVREV